MKPPPASSFRIAAVLLAAGILALRDWTGAVPAPVAFTAASLRWQPWHILIPASLLLFALPAGGSGIFASLPARLAAFGCLLPLHGAFWTTALIDPLHGAVPALLLFAGGARLASAPPRDPARALFAAAALAGALLIREPGALLLPCLAFPAAAFPGAIRFASRPQQVLFGLFLLYAILREAPAPSIAPLLHVLNPPLPDPIPAGALRTVAILAPVPVLLLAALGKPWRPDPGLLAVPAAATLASLLAGGAPPRGPLLAVLALAFLAAAGISAARTAPAIRPAVYAAVLLLAAAHGVRSWARLGEVRLLALEEERLEASLERALDRAQPDRAGTDWVLGAPRPPMGERPDPRVLIRLPPAGGILPPDSRLRIFQWGAPLLPDRGRPDRYRLALAFEAEIAGPGEIELVDPPPDDRRYARHAGDEPVFRWSVPAGEPAEAFLFAWWGTDRDTGRLRFQSRLVGGDVLAVEQRDGRSIYTWRPSIRPAGGEMRELIWEDGDFAAPPGAMHWTVAPQPRNGAKPRAAAPRSIAIELPPASAGGM